MTTKTWSNPGGNWQNDPNDWSPPGLPELVFDSRYGGIPNDVMDRRARLVEAALGPEHSRHDAAAAP